MNQLLDKTQITGSSPNSVFVSHVNYPDISIAPMALPMSQNDADLYDNHERWFGLQKNKILNFRQNLLRANIPINVKDALHPGKNLQLIQELAMAERQTEVELELKKKPYVDLQFSNYYAPMGPSAPLKEFRITENTKIPEKIDSIVGDSKLLANEGLNELYENEFSLNHLQRIFSAGLLGVKEQRKIVPTKWSITAIDSNLSEKLISNIREYEKLEEIELFESSYMYNHFWLALLPGEWSFEMLEHMEGKNELTIDFEFYEGRKNYAFNVAGGYYAARLAAVEYLQKIKKQASVIVFRTIGAEYHTSLGVWQVRENCRNGMQQKPMIFSDKNLLKQYLQQKIQQPSELFFRDSRLWDKLTKQTRLFQFA